MALFQGKKPETNNPKAPESNQASETIKENPAMTTPVTKKKISVKNIKLSDLAEGASFTGVYRGQVMGASFVIPDKKTGELVSQSLVHEVFEDDKGERVSYVADKGFQQALAQALVKPGQKIEVVKLPKANIGKGRTMNQYDIFDLS